MIIDSQEQLQELQREVIGKELILIPILEDEYLHLAANCILGHYIKILDTQKEYTAFINHPEAVCSIDILPHLAEAKKIYCYNKQSLIYNRTYVFPNMVDAFMQMYLYENQIPDVGVSKSAEFYKRRIPIKTTLVTDVVKLQERARQIADLVVIHANECELFYETTFANVFHHIEKNGLKVKKQAFIEKFGDANALIGDYTFTKYNFYTATGRPSNRFGGVNYAALNKEDDTREMFVSRYDNGILVELDFQSYHPRILADIVGYVLDDKENIYEHLAKHYFQTDAPTFVEITEAKEETFRQLYGGIANKYKSIEYFNRIQNFTDILWDSFTKDGYIQSLISKRVLHRNNIDDVSPTKLLNYYIQLHETEQNVTLLNELFKILDEDIKPILYTYDSVLFDLPKDKEQSLREAFTKVIPTKFPYRIKTGTNYKGLE